MEQTTQYSRLVWLACLLFVATSGCGKPMIYHFEHYHRPFAAIAKSNQTYFHSQQTGKIIPKDPCAGYCEPGCFGYEPTTWTHWPQECPGNFPVQGDTFVEHGESYETTSEVVVPAPTDAAGFYSAEEGVLMLGDGPAIPENAPDAPSISHTESPSTSNSASDETPRDPRSIVVPPKSSEGLGIPAPSITIPSDLESSGPSPSDGTNASPELPQLPFTRLEPPTTKLPTDTSDIAITDEDAEITNGRSSNGSQNQDKTASDSLPAVKLVEMPPAATQSEQQFKTIEIKATPADGQEDSKDSEPVVRILVPQTPNLVAAPVPSAPMASVSDEKSSTTQKLQDAQLRNISVVGRRQIVAHATASISEKASTIRQTAAEKPVEDSKPVTKTRDGDDYGNQPKIDDRLFSARTLRRPKKIRVDKLPVKPQPLRLNLQRMTPSGLPLAKKVSPKKATTNKPAIGQPKTEKPMTEKAAGENSAAEKVVTRKLTPSKTAVANAKPTEAAKVAAKPVTRPSQNLAGTTKSKGSITSSAMATLTTTSSVSPGQHMSRPILKQTSQPLAKPGQLKMLATATQAAKKDGKPIQKLVASHKSQSSGVWKNPSQTTAKSMLGFNEAKPTKKLASKPTEKPAVSVSLTVSEEASSMIQFAKDPPRREIRVSSVPDGGPSVRFR